MIAHDRNKGRQLNQMKQLLFWNALTSLMCKLNVLKISCEKMIHHGIVLLNSKYGFYKIIIILCIGHTCMIACSWKFVHRCTLFSPAFKIGHNFCIRYSEDVWKGEQTHALQVFVRVFKNVLDLLLWRLP